MLMGSRNVLTIVKACTKAFPGSSIATSAAASGLLGTSKTIGTTAAVVPMIVRGIALNAVNAPRRAADGHCFTSLATIRRVVAIFFCKGVPGSAAVQRGSRRRDDAGRSGARSAGCSAAQATRRTAAIMLASYGSARVRALSGVSDPVRVNRFVGRNSAKLFRRFLTINTTPPSERYHRN
eukprot:1779136-Prymnesium_polylepis.1